MAVIQFSEADKLAGRLMDKGPATVEVSEIDGPKASSSQKSMNFFLTIKVTSGAFMNKELSIIINSETKEPSLLGTMQFFPQLTFGKLMAAVNKLKFEDLPIGPIDTDLILHKPFDVIIGQETANGNIINTVGNLFYPAGAAAAANTVAF